MSDAEATTPFFGRCETCGHSWPVCYLPLPLEKAAGLMQRAACPKGCDGRVFAAGATEAKQ